MSKPANKHLRGELRQAEPLAAHTSWRVGGCAQYYYIPADREDLCCFLQQLPPQAPVVFLGLGSNVLIRDGGIKGYVIATQDKLNAVHRNTHGTIYAEAGVTCAKLARFSVQHGLHGGEFFAGIPGTVGGALMMNAGAFGGETWNVVSEIEVVDRAGNVYTRAPHSFNIAYRSVQGLQVNEWFLAARFSFTAQSAENDGVVQIKQLLSRRNDSQPIGVYSCGSVFKNPPGDYAARLIEAAGLKGYRIGGAYISDKHANFIINDKNASALHIEQLIEHVRATVAKHSGIILHTEVCMMGEIL